MTTVYPPRAASPTATLRRSSPDAQDSQGRRGRVGRRWREAPAAPSQGRSEMRGEPVPGAMDLVADLRDQADPGIRRGGDQAHRADPMTVGERASRAQRLALGDRQADRAGAATRIVTRAPMRSEAVSGAAATRASLPSCQGSAARASTAPAGKTVRRRTGSPTSGTASGRRPGGGRRRARRAA